MDINYCTLTKVFRAGFAHLEVWNMRSEQGCKWKKPSAWWSGENMIKRLSAGGQWKWVKCCFVREMRSNILSIEHELFWWSNACILSFNSWKRHVYDMVRAGRTFSTFSEIAIGSSISMSRFTRLGSDLARGFLQGSPRDSCRSKLICRLRYILSAMFFVFGDATASGGFSIRNDSNFGAILRSR